MHSPSTPPPQKKPNLLLATTGSVATIKLPQLISQLLPSFNIKIITTKHVHDTIMQSQHFFQTEEYKLEEKKYLQDVPDVQVYEDSMEWEMWGKRGDPVLHIELRKWADCLLIAPLSANTLAKLAQGQCNNLLTLVCRAWPMQKDPLSHTLLKPIIVCPSMNTMMWEHPITATQIEVLKSWGYRVLGPVAKVLMCGEVGNGAMMEVGGIVSEMLALFPAEKQGKDDQEGKEEKDKYVCGKVGEVGEIMGEILGGKQAKNNEGE